MEVLPTVRLVIAVIVIAALGCESISTQKPESPSPTATYVRFRSLIETTKYSEAFALMDDVARQEFRSVVITVLGIAGVPSSRLRDMSDIEMFVAFMSYQTPHKFEIISENVDGDIATLDVQITQGDHTQSVTIKMKKHGHQWLIHSTGVAFGK